MKKFFLILSMLFIVRTQATFLGKWDEDYQRLSHSLKRKKSVLVRKSLVMPVNIKKLIEAYKKRNASHEEKQWRVGYYARKRHDTC